MQRVFLVGDEPIPGYKLIEDMGGSAFYKQWKVRTAQGEFRQWKVIDMVVGNAAIETRTLGLLVQIRHPRLSTLTNFWQIDEGKLLIVESDLPTMSLRNRLEQYQKKGETGIPLKELVEYTAQAADALDFLNAPKHQYQGQLVAVYHRSLRPECLLLYQQGNDFTCKVSDFGLAKPVTEETAQHSQGLVHYDYDPPEFFEGQTAPSSDQYALAINYYELRTGKLPFQGTMLEQLQARLNDSPDLALIEEPERGVVRKGLARDPANRYANCTEFARNLKAAVGASNARSIGVATSAGPPPTKGSPSVGARKSPIQQSRSSSPGTDLRPPSTPISQSRSGAGANAAAKSQTQIPGVVYHKRPDQDEDNTPVTNQQPQASQSRKQAIKEEAVPKGAQNADLKTLRQQLSGQAKPKKFENEPGETMDTKVPFWAVALIILVLIGAIVGGLMYFDVFGSAAAAAKK